MLKFYNHSHKKDKDKLQALTGNWKPSVYARGSFSKLTKRLLSLAEKAVDQTQGEISA